MPLRNSDIGYYMDTQMTRFTSEQVAICPNACGEMNMRELNHTGAAPEAFASMAPLNNTWAVPEACAQFSKCGHQMVVADERPQCPGCGNLHPKSYCP